MRLVLPRRLAPVVFLAAAAAVVSCGGTSNPGPGPTPNQPVQNSAPVIQSLTAALPPGRTEAETDIDVTVAVQDTETAIGNLIFNWTASIGTITGTGPAVKWRLATNTATTPADVTIRVEVVERYANFDSAGAPITSENRVNREIVFRAHDSRAEIARITVRFLVDLFGNSAVSPAAAVADFWNGDKCVGSRNAELEDTQENRDLFVILEASATVQSVTFVGVDDADVVAACRWRDRVKANGSTGVSQGPCLLTSVYRQNRWWLCESTIDKTGLFTRTCDDGTSSCIPASASQRYRSRMWAIIK